PSPEPLGGLRRDLVVRAPAVDGLGHDVEQLRQLDHLAVGAPCDVRRLLETGTLVLADQLDAVGEARRRRVVDRSLVGLRATDFGLLLCRGGGDRVVSLRVRAGGTGPPARVAGVSWSA